MIVESAADPIIPGNPSECVWMAGQLRRDAERALERQRHLNTVECERWTGSDAAGFRDGRTEIAERLGALAQRYERMASIATAFATELERLQFEEARLKEAMYDNAAASARARFELSELPPAPVSEPWSFQASSMRPFADTSAPESWGEEIRRNAQRRFDDTQVEAAILANRAQALRDEFDALAHGAVIELRALNQPGWCPVTSRVRPAELVEKGSLHDGYVVLNEDIDGGTRSIYFNEFGVVVCVTESKRGLETVDTTRAWRLEHGTEVDRMIAEELDLAPNATRHTRAALVLIQGGTIEDANEALVCDPMGDDCENGAAVDVTLELALQAIDTASYVALAGSIATVGVKLTTSRIAARRLATRLTQEELELLAVEASNMAASPTLRKLTGPTIKDYRKLLEAKMLGRVAFRDASTGGQLILYGTEFQTTELPVARLLARQGHDVVLREAPGTVRGVRTSDLFVDGVKWDVYTPTTGDADRIVGRAATKGGQVEGGGVIIDLAWSPATAEDLANITARVQGVSGRVNEIKVVNSDDLLE